MRNKLLYMLCLSMALLTSCRDDEIVIYTEEYVIKPTEAGDAKGMYLLCEGNMGSNKCTIDYLDLSNSDGNTHYLRNIYSSRNPTTVKELGDVGNDIQIYGSKLWMVINCSNKVEVCDAVSCKRIGQVNIPNCRYVTFSGRYAYVSSYVGPLSDGTQRGRVYKVDTLTLEKVDSVTVGYQPEEMAVVNGKLYVANSGGYRAPEYDNTVSVIDLSVFCEERKIEVAPNLHRLRTDKYGQIWVSSRGNYNDVKSGLFYLKDNGSGEMVLGGSVSVPVSDICIVGDSLFYLGSQWSNITNRNSLAFGLIDIRKHTATPTSLFSAAEVGKMTLPYGLIVNPKTKDFYLFDAKDYVSSGELLHFLSDGTFDWRQWTGDIPSCAVFVDKAIGMVEEYEPKEGDGSRYILAVDEYVPAPGQFVNILPEYEDGDDAAAMARKCTELIANGKGGMISLGGYGGYITFHFDHSVKNVEDEYDLYIKGNAFYGSCEPGIVMVSQDTNGNGLPDDDWYELSGSADVDSVGKVRYGYEITYSYSSMQDVPWKDNRGKTGYIYKNDAHKQEYYPLWLTDRDLKFKGTLLPDNYYFTTMYIGNRLRYGYVDNMPNRDIEGCSFKIDWAVEPVSRKPVKLNYIDFIRVYCATNQQCGAIGEISTEICGAEDLHVK